MSKDEIFGKLKGILVSDFEIDEASITPEATLFDDLELDSIDSILVAAPIFYIGMYFILNK